MTTDTRDTLDSVISLRVNATQRADLQAAAERHGMTVSELVRVAAEVVGGMEPDELRALLASPTCKGSGRRHAPR